MAHKFLLVVILVGVISAAAFRSQTEDYDNLYTMLNGCFNKNIFVF